MSGNAPGANGAVTPPEFEYKVFDAFPRWLKEMMWNYAYPLNAIAVEAQARKHDALSGVYRAELYFEDLNRDILARFRDRQIEAHWPEGHPMIGQALRDDWT